MLAIGGADRRGKPTNPKTNQNQNRKSHLNHLSRCGRTSRPGTGTQTGTPRRRKIGRSAQESGRSEHAEDWSVRCSQNGGQRANPLGFAVWQPVVNFDSMRGHCPPFQRKRSAGTRRRFRRPRQGAQKDSTWPDAPLAGARVQVLLFLFKGRKAQVGGLSESSTRRYARQSIVFIAAALVPRVSVLFLKLVFAPGRHAASPATLIIPRVARSSTAGGKK